MDGYNLDRWRFLAGGVVLAAAAVVLLPAASVGADAKRACHNGGREPTEITTRQARRSVACRIDLIRREHGVGPLNSTPSLNEAARKHSKRMATTGCFAHVCPGEPGIYTRFWRVGYFYPGLSSWAWGENAAYGDGHYATPRMIVKSWMHSPSHRAGMLSRKYEDVGVGVAWRRTDHGRWHRGYYTADFGFRRG